MNFTFKNSFKCPTFNFYFNRLLNNTLLEKNASGIFQENVMDILSTDLQISDSSFRSKAWWHRWVVSRNVALESEESLEIRHLEIVAAGSKLRHSSVIEVVIYLVVLIYLVAVIYPTIIVVNSSNYDNLKMLKWDAS